MCIVPYLINYTRDIKANYIIRGIRSQIDFEYEKQMSNVNRGFNPFIETIFLIPPVNVVDISSSFVKGLIGPKGWERIIGLYVPKAVEKYILYKNIKGFKQP
jgi:pantetheine-phosphate adenylyltransferase